MERRAVSLQQLSVLCSLTLFIGDVDPGESRCPGESSCYINVATGNSSYTHPLIALAADGCHGNVVCGMTLRYPLIDRQHSMTSHRHDDDVDDVACTT